MSKFRESAELALEFKKEINSKLQTIIGNLFKDKDETSYDKKSGTFNRDFTDGALWVGKDKPCADVPIKGFNYNKKNKFAYLNPLDPEKQKIRWDAMTMDDQIRFICFMDRNGYDLDALLMEPLAEPETKEEAGKAEAPKDEPAKENAPDKTGEADNDKKEADTQDTPDEEQNHDEGEAEEQSVACYTGKPITPTDDIF